jgi:hypothetical protein
LKLLPHETDLIGGYTAVGTTLVADNVTRRIEYLTKSELKLVGPSPDGWDLLFRDPQDGRYWERTYPQSHLQGGGAPRLTLVGKDQIRVKYGLDKSK